MRTEPYVVGEEIRLRSYGRGERIYLILPSGIEMHVPALTGSYTLTLSEPGEWTVRWENGEPEKLQVIAAPLASLELIEQEPPPPKPTHPLSSTS